MTGQSANRVVLVGCCAAVLACAARADISATFTDAASFAAATNTVTTVSFETFGVADTDAEFHSGFDTGFGVEIDADILLVGKSHTNAALGFSSGFHDSTYVSTETEFDGVTFVLDSAATAFGLDLGTVLTGSGDLTVIIEFGDSGDSQAITVDSALDFIGFTLDSAETEINLFFGDASAETVNNRIAFDDLRFGAAGGNPVPAPGAAVLAILGFGSLAHVRRRRG